MSNVSMINGHIDGAETCVICGRDIPEGSQVCVICGDVGKKKCVEKMNDKSICRSCFHSYVCEQFNENRHITDNKKCHFYNDHFVPTKDMVEVKHGYWKHTQEPLGCRDVDCVECSVCGESWIMDEDLSLEEQTQGWNYCLNCGAKMDGERRGKEE